MVRDCFFLFSTTANNTLSVLRASLFTFCLPTTGNSAISTNCMRFYRLHSLEAKGEFLAASQKTFKVFNEVLVGVFLNFKHSQASTRSLRQNKQYRTQQDRTEEDINYINGMEEERKGQKSGQQASPGQSRTGSNKRRQNGSAQDNTSHLPGPL